MGNTPVITNEVEDVGKVNLAADYVEGNAVLVDGDTNELHLIPVPSSDPNDPLNWSNLRKAGVVVICCWFSIMSLSVVGGLVTILDVLGPYYAKEGKSTQQVSYLATISNITIGVGSFMIIPLSLAYGRRPTFLISAIIMLVSVIWAAFSQSYNSHLVARIIQGLAAGASESLLPLLLSEISFLHQRASLLGIYWAIQSLITAMLSIAASYEAAVSWRWFYGVFAITIAVGLVGAFFLAPETRYQRKGMVVGNQVVYTDEFGQTNIMSYDEAATTIRNLEDANRVGNSQAGTPKKTFLQELNPWSGMIPNGLALARQSYVRMLECYTSPGVWYSALTAAVSLGCAMGMGVTISNVLANTYHWPSANVGLYNVGTIPAALAALVYSGWFADKVSVWLARANGGIHKPEMRLIPLVLPFIVGVVALMIYGVSTEWPERYTWAGPVLGWNLFQFSFISTLVISTTFTAEIRPRDPGPALVVLSATKHWISFGLQYGMNPLVDYAGYLWAMGILTIIFAGSLLLGIPVYFLNPRWRARVPSESGLMNHAR